MHLIEAKNVTKTYGKEPATNTVLKGVTLTIDEGEFIAITGKSGAGKSTLLYQLSALDRPSSGQVYIDGEDVHTFSESVLADFRLYTLGYIFQDYALIPSLDAIENVLTPLLMRGLEWGVAHKTAASALESVGLFDKATQYPAELSGGEQQRVSIARATAGKPKILFADEPTANLDSVSGQTVIDRLLMLHQRGQTIVMVTHEKEYTAGCDRVVQLEDGKVVLEYRP